MSNFRQSLFLNLKKIYEINGQFKIRIFTFYRTYEKWVNL